MIAWLNGKLEEHYVPVRTLKQSPASEVQVLRHKTLQTDIIKRTYTGSPEVYQTLMTIHHQNLTRVYEVVEDGPKVLVLEEFIDGVTLAEELSARTYGEDETRHIVLALCNALAALHALGIIHRDIKPENVMVDKTNVIKLIDFNAAKFYKSYKVKDTIVIGTTGFAAPEQFGIAQSDERTDIYSLGILLNVMLTGEHPSRKLYAGKRLAKVIETCTQITPNKRYPDVFSLAKELR